MPTTFPPFVRAVTSMGAELAAGLPPDVRDQLLADVESTLSRPWVAPSEQDFNEFFDSGVREKYDRAVEADHAQLAVAVLAQHIWPSSDGLSQVRRGLELLAKRTRWHLPAHEKDHPSQGGFAREGQNRSLDMVSAETGALAAWALLLHGPALADEMLVANLRSRIEVEVLQRYLDSEDAWIGRLKRPSNWNPWVNHQVLVAGCLSFPDSPMMEQVVAKVSASLSHYIALLPADGGAEEGFTYWWQGPAHLIEALTWFDNEHRPDLPARLLHALCVFPVEMAVDNASTLTFTDSERWMPDNVAWHLVHQEARGLDDTDLAARAGHLAQRRVPLPDIGQSLERSLRCLIDSTWLATTFDPPSSSGGVSYESSGVHIARARGERESVLAVTVGDNGQLHNHLDVGGYSFWVGGEPVVIDLGAPTYSSSTFGSSRHEKFAVSSSWHSVPFPNGMNQGVGSECRATDVSIRRKPAEEFVLQASLDTAYPGCDVDWRRTFLLSSQGDGLCVSDRWSWPAEEGVALIRVVLPGLAVRDGPDVLIPLDAGLVSVHIDGADEIFLEAVHIEDERVAKAWGPSVNRLLVRSTQARGQFTTTFRVEGRGRVSSVGS